MALKFWKSEVVKKKSLWKSLLVSCLGMVLMTVAFHFLEYRSDQIRIFPEPFRNQTGQSTDGVTIFKDHIRPLILQYHRENQKAMNQAVSDLETCFRGYEAGIDAFVDDMTGMGSRLGMVGRQFRDWWDNVWNGVEGKRVAQSVQESFEKHVYSEERIRGDVSLIMDTLVYGLNANQNQMVCRIQEIVRETESGIDPGKFVMTSYNQALKHTWNAGFEGMGQKALINMAQSITIDVLTSWSAVWQFVPEPYRTPVALVVALVVDYWNTERLASNLRAECRDMVRHTRDAVLYDMEKGIVPRMNRDMENLYKANLETTENLMADNLFDRFGVMLRRIFRM